MTVRPRALMSWSSGKDSAFALHAARTAGEVEIVGLLTTLTDAYGRVSMHGVREALLDRQAEELGLPCAKLIASHDLEMILDLCPRMIILDEGQVRADGPTAELLRDEALMTAHGLETPSILRAPR